MANFKYDTPESQSIDSKGISTFLREVSKHGLELHRIMIIRHGVCVAKGCAAPYKEEQLHPVYSYSKSFTSTAIGYARQEGLLSLDEKLVDIFPEAMPETISEHLSKVTIRHLLTMSCGHATEIDAEGEHWLERFFAHPFEYEPGTVFIYNTAGTNVLSAIIKKKTGEDLLTYLKPRLFDPLEFGPVDCAILPDGTCHGGGGMKLQLEDMAKFAYFMLQKGVWNGKTLLPGWYEEMGSKQIETEGEHATPTKDWAQGYGYQCWMCLEDGSFRADGAFGQFGLVYPSLDLLVITNMATEMTQTFMDLVNEFLLPAVKTDQMKTEEASGAEQKNVIVYNHTETLSPAAKLRHKLRHMKIASLSGSRNPTMEAKLTDAIYEAESIEDGMVANSFDTLIGGSGLFGLEDSPAIVEMQFTFASNQCVWSVYDGMDRYNISASLEGRFLYSKVKGHEYAATARWRSREALELEVRRMDALSGVRMIFRFDGDRLAIEAEDTLITDGGLGITERHMPAFICRSCD